MRILPLYYLDTLSDEQITMYECSDKLWFSTRTFERLVTDGEPGVVTILKLTNGVDQSVVGAMHAVHTDDDEIIYAPRWVCEALEYDHDNITIARFQASLCMGLTLQPHTSDHITAPDPQELLRDAFEHYSCLTRGQTLTLWIQHPEPHAFEVTVADLQGGDTVCIRDCELELELLRPLDMPLTPPPSPPPSPPMNAVVAADPPLLQGDVLGGTIPQNKTARELRLEAAMRRLNNTQ